MTGLAIAGWGLCFVLLALLLYGQPAATAANLARIESQSQENAMLRATVNARPPPTPVRR